MKRRADSTYACPLLVTVLGPAGTARAGPITFSEYPVGTLIDNQYASQGVRFLPGDPSGTPRLPQIAADNPLWMPTEPFLRPTGEPTLAPFQGDFWMEFTTPVSSVEFVSGSWDQVGAGQILVYDPSGTLVGNISNTHLAVETFDITGLGPIKKIHFNSITDPSGAGIDNLSFTPIVAVPAPGALLLAGLGTGAVGWLRRRRALA